MAAQKFLTNNAGTITEVQAKDTSAGAGDAGKLPALNASGILDSTIVNSKATSAGAGDAGKIVALNSAGVLDLTLFGSGMGPEIATVNASEALAAGDFVNIWNSTGTAKARKADASTSGKEAHGYVLSAVNSAADATVYFTGTNTAVTGATPGPQFLATSAGLAVATAPSGSGNVVQRLGVATSATSILFEPTAPIVLA